MEIAFDGVTVMKGDRAILQDVGGVARPGQVLAVMGPSGGGKTTLLNSLAGRSAVDSGNITFNGVALNKSMKRKLSYVLQDDVFFANITLREMLSFTTMLRLPDKMPKKEKMQMMEEIIDELDIRKCLDTIMGDSWTRGLSGGEKKRASIACALITDPTIIFLDEPTSGLDYSTASSLVRTLRSITEAQNKTVVMTIHQPSSQMFFTFHDLLLLCDGQLAYFGPCRNVIDFFADVGFVMDSHYNPADFIIEKLKEGQETKSQILAAAKCRRQNEISLQQGVPVQRHRRRSSQPKNHSKLQDNGSHAVGSNDTADVHVSLMDITEGGAAADEVAYEGGDEDEKWPTGWVTQYTQLVLRSFRQSRTRITSRLKMVEAALLCLLVSLIWFQLPRTEETLRDRMGALFFTTIHWAFSPLFDAVSSFPMERTVIHKERSAGWYRLSAYFLAKLTSELPLNLFQPAVFVTISYWCIGFNGLSAFLATCVVIVVNSAAGQIYICIGFNGGSAFFANCVVIKVNAATGQATGLLLGIACMDMQKAMTIATIFMMAIMLLGGFYTRTLPVWLTWIKYTSFLHYSFHSAMFLEFTDAAPVRCTVSSNASQFSQCLQPNVTHVSSQDVLQFYDVTLSFWHYFLPLFAITGGCWFLGYLLLRFVYRPQSG